MEKVQNAVKKTLTNLPISIRAVMSVLGLLITPIPAVQWARPYVRSPSGNCEELVLWVGGSLEFACLPGRTDGPRNMDREAKRSSN